MTTKINIAIDGHSSTGKGTLARQLAESLNYLFIDSGSMYRAVAYYFIQQNILINDLKQVEQALEDLNLQFVKNAKTQRYEICINRQSVEPYIRTMEVASIVSEVAAISSVRTALVRMQKELGVEKGVVMDGRDIGTVVFPDAELKIFMTAEPEIRAQRRFEELKQSGADVSYEEVLLNLKNRDSIDSSRKDSPLTLTKAYRLLDNSHISPKEQLEIALEWVREVQNQQINP